MASKSITNEYVRLLNFLESNGVATLRQIGQQFNCSQEEIDPVIIELCGKDNNHLIKIVPSLNTGNQKLDDTYEITLKGISFLNEYYSKELVYRQTEYGKILAVVGCAAVFITFVEFFSNPEKLNRIISEPGGLNIMGTLVVIILGIIFVYLASKTFELMISK